MFADIGDLLARSPEPLTGEQEVWASSRVVDAETALITRVPRLADPTKLSARDTANARAVVCDAVLRVLVNPQGLVSEGAGAFRAEFGNNRSGSALYFTADELALFKAKHRRKIGMIGIAPIL